MALQQYQQGSTYFGYDPGTNQGIAFSDPTAFNQYFPSFQANAPTPTFDVSGLLASPNKLMSVAGATPGYYGPSAPTPTSAVATSQNARSATTTNLNNLGSSEAALSVDQSAANLSQVYQGRTDLQGLYNPDGTAKNASDPRVAGIPTLADWAAKYGQGEESLLKGFTSSPAINAMLARISQGLTTATRAGGSLDPNTKQTVNDVNSLTNKELAATAAARTAANEDDYRSLDFYMTELQQIRKNRDQLVTKLLGQTQQTEEEMRLAKDYAGIVNKERQTSVQAKEDVAKIESQNIVRSIANGQSLQTIKMANIQLERMAIEKMAVVDQLQLAQQTRQNGIEMLRIAIDAVDQDSAMVFQLANFAQELAKTEKAEREAARDFAIENNISAPFYLLAGTVYKSDGTKTYSDEQTFFTDAGVTTFNEAVSRGLLMNLEPGSADERALVMDMASRYPDAGIGLQDDLTTAQQKIRSSGIYRDQVRPPLGAGGGGGGSPVPGDDPQLYAGLTPQTATAVRGQVSAFKSEPLVQNFAVIQEGRNFAQSLSDTTQNPADDQALIYSLAKALDPGSVVREGEYATAQKYAQSWVKAYGKGAEQAILGTGFLSATARKNIKQTIEQKYLSSKVSYDNLYGQYATGIGTLTGRGDGQSFLRNYAIQPTAGEFLGPAPATSTASEPEEKGFWSSLTKWIYN